MKKKPETVIKLFNKIHTIYCDFDSISTTLYIRIYVFISNTPPVALSMDLYINLQKMVKK